MNNIKKYYNDELQKELRERKTLYEKYRRYNTFMYMFSAFISVIAFLAVMMLFDSKVMNSQINFANKHFADKTFLISKELSFLINYQFGEEDFELYVKALADRLENSDLKVVIKTNKNGIYTSDKIDENTLNNLENDPYKYLVQKYQLPNNYIVYFLLPKVDNRLIRNSFLLFVVLIFILATVLRSGFSHTIMKKIYENMVVPLDKLKDATNNIRKGNYDIPLVCDECYNRDIKSTFKEFEKMRVELKEKKALYTQYENNRKELITNISHDLKTPISSIIGYIEGLLDGVANTEEKKNRYLEIIYKKSLDLNRLINDLILYSKLDVKQVKFDYEYINFREYVTTLFQEYELELSENNVKLISNYDGSDIKMYIDGNQLRRVFNNIIGNALKHMEKENKVVVIDVKEYEDDMRIDIIDNGIGIESDKLDSVFERFYKADESRNTDMGSSGLGLSISKKIVEAHGGKIWAESELGLGTTISFTLVKGGRHG